MMMATQIRVCITLVIVAAASMSGCAHRASGEPGGVWELRGAIVTVTGEHLAIRHKTGQVVDLLIDDRTIVLHDEQPQGREALRRGRRVRVEVEQLAAGGNVARTVRVYGGGS
ncbi:MAG TPA: hypothetical protein VL173_13740 [Vicinamibacterales bacterium]|jgi:hypothetical protein|nr:hypothetical protein [Vicinamibacterales bacterium]